MRNNKDTTIRQRVMTVTLEHNDLIRLISQEARTAFAPSSVSSLAAGTQYDIKIRQLKEGSPEYSVQKWEADVTITEKI